MATSLAVADLGKRLLEASRKGNAEEVRQLMATGAPITTDWVRILSEIQYRGSCMASRKKSNLFSHSFNSNKNNFIY